MMFELSGEIPIPISVGERDGRIVLILQEGAVVGAALVRALNDLARDNGEQRSLRSPLQEQRQQEVAVGQWR